jgi:four helix bundle protein
MAQHRKLVAWQKAMSLTEEVYRVTAVLPQEERFGLVAQMRRCSVSIPSNIAEGCGRSGPKDRVRFLDVAYGSLLELETQLEVSRRLRYVSDDVFNSWFSRTSEVGRMLNGLKRSLLAQTED